jgi:hypothetical protein
VVSFQLPIGGPNFYPVFCGGQDGAGACFLKTLNFSQTVSLINKLENKINAYWFKQCICFSKLNGLTLLK